MTREEACNVLNRLKPNDVSEVNDSAYCIGEALAMAVEALSAELCEDAISRKDAKISLVQFMRNQKSLCECIDDCSSVQPKVKTGHWMFKDADDQACSIYTCDKCGEQITILDDTIKSPQEGRYNYCPNCGAKMVEPQESEDKE